MASDAKLDKIQIVYQKARHHRTFHVDGAWAGITPLLEVQLALYNDLHPMPDEVFHRVGPDGNLLEEIKLEEASPSILRETDVTVVMNKDVVNSLIELLQRMVLQIDQHIEKTSKASAEREEQPSGA